MKLIEECRDIRRGEIYDIGHIDTVGSEQQGNRPVLIVSDDGINRNSPEVTICFITSQLEKMGERYHIHLSGVVGLDKVSMVLAEQIRTIDKSRLLARRGRLDERTMNGVNRGLKNCLGLESVQVKMRKRLKGKKKRVRLEWRSRKSYRNELLNKARVINAPAKKHIYKEGK